MHHLLVHSHQLRGQTVHGAPPLGGHEATSEPERKATRLGRMNLWEMLITGWTPKHEGEHMCGEVDMHVVTFVSGVSIYATGVTFP